MTETELEQFVKDKGLHPYGMMDIDGSKVFIAETELETNKPNEYPWGYYQVAWFVSSSASHGKIDGGSWVEFEAMHDKDQSWTQEEKRQKRIQAAIENAQEWIELNIKAGRYESH
jgi:hypothetical protein